jgi:hypothetical protein
MAGGMGGRQTSETTIPQFIQDAAQRNLSRADDIASMGYVREYGPSVAAFTPMQEAAFQNTADAASAFGMDGGDLSETDLRGGMDAPTTYENGVRGYSATPIFEDMVTQLEENAPGQYAYLNSFSIDPVTGEMGSRAAPAAAAAAAAAPAAAPAAATGQGATQSGATAAGGLYDNTMFTGGASNPYTSSNTLLSYLPGGVNTRNPASAVNQTVAGLARPQGPPTAASRPVARPTRGVS